MNTLSVFSQRGERRMRSGRAFAALILVSAISLACGGPLGPFSGARLSGEEGEWPVDWAAVADVVEIQLESAPDDPYSVNLWFAVLHDDAYVVSSLLMGPDDPEERGWVKNVASDPQVRVRVGSIVYPARLEQIDDVELSRQVYLVFLEKYPQLDESRGDAARYFRIVRP